MFPKFAHSDTRTNLLASSVEVSRLREGVPRPETVDMPKNATHPALLPPRLV